MDLESNLNHANDNGGVPTGQRTGLWSWRRAVHQQRYIYRYVLDAYRARSHAAYIMLEVSSFLSALLTLLSLFTGQFGNGFTVSSAIITALIGVAIKILQRLYPEEELGRLNAYLKRLKMFLVKLSNPDWTPKPRQLQQLDILLKSAPTISIREQEEALHSYRQFLKHSASELCDDRQVVNAV